MASNLSPRIWYQDFWTSIQTTPMSREGIACFQHMVGFIWNGIGIFIWNLRTSYLRITVCLGDTEYPKTLEHSTASNSNHSWYLHCLCRKYLCTLTVGRGAAGFLDVKSWKRSNFPSYNSFFSISLVRSFALYTTCKMNLALVKESDVPSKCLEGACLCETAEGYCAKLLCWTHKALIYARLDSCKAIGWGRGIGASQISRNLLEWPMVESRRNQKGLGGRQGYGNDPKVEFSYYFRLISIAHGLWKQLDLAGIVFTTTIMSISCVK